jgi:hypothetical protein
MNRGFIIILNLAIASLFLVHCQVNLEKTLLRLGTTSVRAVIAEVFEQKTGEVNLLLHFNPILTVNPVWNILTIDYPDMLQYPNDTKDLNEDVANFSNLSSLRTIVRFSQGNSRMHLNFNREWNGGFVIRSVNLVENTASGERNVEVRFEDTRTKQQPLTFVFNFESVRPVEDINAFVQYLNTLVRK